MCKNNWEVLYHYTTLNGFQKILETGSISLTDIIKSNDPSEGIYSMQMLKEAYKKLYSYREIDDKTYRKFHNAFFEFSEREMSFGRLQQAVLSVSFCEPELPLALWRTYGDNGRGVSIGVSKKKLEEIGQRENFSFQRIEYLSENEMIDKYVEFWKRHILSNDEALLEALCEQYFEGYFIKREENAYEREWRLVYTGLKFDDYLLMSSKVPKEVCAYMLQNDVVFYYRLSIKDEKFLQYVCIGPQCKISDSEMRCLLAKYGIEINGVSRDNTVMR